jgi:RNA polymerase sigma-70 factor (ECF subfamily)
VSVPPQPRPGRHLRVLRPLRRHSDARLVELARRGDEDAFSCLVDRYRRELLIYAHRLLGAESRAEDALQQALFGAWLALRDHDREVDNPRAWLYRCVHNSAVTILRRAQHETITLEDARNAGACTPGADRRTELSAVITELGRLPETERRALIMTSVSGASHEEAAETLGVSRAAVRGMVYRARTSLRTAVGGLMPWGAWNWLSNLAGGGGSGDGVGVAAGSAGVGAVVLKGGAVIAAVGAVGAVGVAGDQVLGPHHSSSHARASRVALTARDAADSSASLSSRHAHGAATRNAPSGTAAHSTTGASLAAPDRGDRPGGQPGTPAGSPGRDEHHGRGHRHDAGEAHGGEHHGGRSTTGSTPGGPGHTGRGGQGGPTHTSPTSGPPTTTSPTSGPPTTTSPGSGPPTTTQPTSGPPTTSSPGGPPTTTTTTRGGTDDRGGDDPGTTTSGGPPTTTGSGRTDDGSGGSDSGSGRPTGAGKAAASGKSSGGSGPVTVASTSPPTTTSTSPASSPTTTGPTTTTVTTTTTTTTTATSTSTAPADDGGGDRHDGGNTHSGG